MATGSHGNSGKLEVSELLVILGELTLSLEHGDTDFGLVIRSSGENLGLLGWDGGVSVNQTSKDTTHSFDTEGKRSNIEKQNVLDVTGQDGTLDGSSDGNGLIRVHLPVGLFIEEIMDELLDLWHSCRTTNEDDFVDLVLGKT